MSAEAVGLRFDGERLRRRRFELGLSETALSRSLGVSPMTLRHIERSGTVSGHTVSFVVAYAQALGLHPLDVFTDDRSTSPASTPNDEDATGDGDARLVGSVLVGSFGSVRIDGLAKALGWTPERTRLALEELAAVVPAVGMRVVVIGDTTVILAPQAGHGSVVAAEAGDALAECGLAPSEFPLVSRLARAGPTTQRKQHDDRTLRRLASAGVLEVGRTGPPGKRGMRRVEVRLSDLARFDLCLSDTPPEHDAPEGM